MKAAEVKAYYSWDKATKSPSLTDEAIDGKLWFCSDTVEGYELVESGKGIEKLAWMPLTLRFDARTVECIRFVLIEVQVEDGIGSEDGYVKTGEKVYGWLGSGNFGQLPSILRQDRLLMGLGAYPAIRVKDEQRQELAKSLSCPPNGR